MIPSINCPECKRKMEVGYDKIANDYYAQCRNRKCNFDGWTALTLEDLTFTAGVSSLFQNAGFKIGGAQ